MTHAPSYQPRKEPTRPVLDQPMNGRDPQLVAKPPEQLAGHLPDGGRAHVPTPMMQGNDHVPPTDWRAPPHSEPGDAEPTTPPKGTATAPALPLVRRRCLRSWHASLTQEHRRASSYPAHRRWMWPVTTRVFGEAKNTNFLKFLSQCVKHVDARSN